MGDMVCTTPMFRAVKKKYPDAYLTVVGDLVNKQLLVGNPNIDGYLIWDKDDPFSIINKIKSEKYDFGCTAGPNFEALAIMILSKIPLISVPRIENGWSPYETIPYKVLRKFVITKPHRMGNYAPREYLRLLETINIFTDDTSKKLYYSSEAGKKRDSLFLENDINTKDLIVGISPSAGNKIKKWPEDRFAQVADYLIEKYQAKILIIGGPNDREESREMLKNIKNTGNVIDLTGKLSVEELKALVSKLKLFISVDTGPIYIAEAFSVPTVDLVGPMDENEQPPIGDFHKIAKAKDRGKPELHIMNARSYNEKGARRQVEDIEVSDVTFEIIRLLKGSTNMVI
jgi:ADP-heptose:LPS heptosyltransferase